MKLTEDINTVGWPAELMQSHVFECHEEIRRLKTALAHYADKSHWDDNTTATEGGDEECKVYMSTECVFFDNVPGWTLADATLNPQGAQP